MTSAQVSGAITTLIEKGWPVERISMGVYRYIPAKAEPVPLGDPDGKLPEGHVIMEALEFIGVTPEGHPILRANGKLYRLVEM